MIDMNQDNEKQSRMRAVDRAAMMIDEADRQINARRSARISPADIAGNLGTSRSLVYSYFPDPTTLVGAVLNRHAKMLVDAGLEEAASQDDLVTSMIDCALIYLDHVVEHGAAIELSFRDKWLARDLNCEMRALSKRLYRRLARRAQQELNYSPNEALGAVQILQSLPEEAAQLVRSGQISIDVAHRLCRRLITASINELRPSPKI